MAMKTSAMSSDPVVTGWRDPRLDRATGKRDIDDLGGQHPLLVFDLEHGLHAQPTPC